MENNLINIKKGKDKNWPFSDPNYQPRIITREYKVLRNGIEIIRTKSKNTVPTRLPDYAVLEIHPPLPQSPEFFLRNSPLSKPRNSKNGRKGKQVEIRPRAKRVFTKLAVHLMEEGHVDSIINPISHKIKHGYLKTIKQLPARLQIKKDTFEI